MKQKRNRPTGIKYDKAPSDRQTKVLVMALKNRGKMQPAMEAAGYSKQTAKNPKNLTESKSWNELLSEYLPDDLLITSVQEGLWATKFDNLSNAQPDYAVRHRYLETALKIKGKLISKIDITQGEKRVVGFNFVLPEGASQSEVDRLNGLSDEQRDTIRNNSSE